MDDEPPQKGIGPEIAIAAPVVLGAALVAMFYFSSEERAYRACEDLLKADLKAPSTYAMVDYTSYAYDNTASVTITYDAENSFGVPIRGTYHCSLDGDLQAVHEPGPDLPASDSSNPA